MAVNAYEGMYILDSSQFAREGAAVSDQVSEMIEKAGGEVLVSRLWEERRLAYPIEGHRKGTYWLTYFRLPSNKLAGLERECQLNDSILRVLFLKVDPRIVDTLVEHAKTGQIGGDKKEETPATEKKDEKKEAAPVAAAEGGESEAEEG